MSTRATTPFWEPGRHRDRRPFLLARAGIVAALRAWFAREGFLEVEPAALQLSPGNETHLAAMAVALTGPDGERLTRRLHTSPEFAMKKLLAAGEERIVAFARVFRDRELTRLHAPEFTMLEWYRAGAPYAAIQDDTVALLRLAAETAGARRVVWGEREADPLADPERLTVADAFRAHAGIDLGAIGDDRDAFADAARGLGLRVADDDDWSDVFSRVLSEKVEPRLGLGRPTLLYEYPAREAALARTVPGRPEVAERFELYLCGVELANGFGELTDADEQRARFLAAEARREAVHGERYPIDEDFLAALAVMPPASGVALGLDRLVMLAAGAPSVHHVLWTPFEG